MKRIEVHDYRTPTEDNRDCPYSVGVMNLTKDEVGYVREFIVNLSRMRWEKLQAEKAKATEDETTTTWSAMRRAAEAERAYRGELPDLYDRMAEDARRQQMLGTEQDLVTGKGVIVPVEEARRYMTGERATVTVSVPFEFADRTEPEPPEPEPVRNRFSGLDIE